MNVNRKLPRGAAGRVRVLSPPSPAVRRRVTGVALAAAGYAATSAAVIASGPLSRGAAVQVLFAATMIVCALSEALLSPARRVVTGDGPRPGRGRSRVGTCALVTTCVLGPSGGGAALGAGWGTSLLTALAVACALAGIATQRPRRHRHPAPWRHAPGASRIPVIAAHHTADETGRRPRPAAPRPYVWQRDWS
jgi:hypothetical protein